MNQTARIISIYAADTSGVCSALYEFGGMTVIHDASGCNSTYTTHDEPRWYDMDSMMYISGLTENDAVMGNDEKFISDLVTAAEELHPEYVAICASPMPAMIGIDMDAIAYEVESRTGIPSFNVKTNGMQSYITGAANAFTALSERFTGTAPDKNKIIKVNILGLTPLDFSLGTEKKLEAWLDRGGFKVNANIGMGTSLDEIRRLDKADVSLVVSSIGRPLAERLYKRYGIPYVTGVPYGKRFAEVLLDELKLVAEHSPDSIIKSDEKAEGQEYAQQGKNREKTETPAEHISSEFRIHDKRIAVVGESVLSASLAAAISLDAGLGTRVLETVGDGDMSQLCGEDISCDDEDRLEKELAGSEIVIADPLFMPICKGKKFIRLPHDAFSGRCFRKEAVDMIDTELWFLDELKEG